MSCSFLAIDWMFVDSNGMAVQCKTPDVVDTEDICDADMYHNPSLSSEEKPSTTLAYEGTKRCGAEAHFPGCE